MPGEASLESGSVRASPGSVAATCSTSAVSVVADPATVDPRFLLDDTKADMIERVIASSWPERIEPGQIGQSSDLEDQIVTAWAGLVHVLELAELVD